MNFSSVSVTPDVLREVFTDAILTRLNQARLPSELLLYRLAVLGASGPYPADPLQADNAWGLRVQRAAWDAYVSAAAGIGLFEGADGRELVSRLTGLNDAGFRSAMAECMAAWFLAGKMGLPLEPRPEGRPGRTLELLIQLEGGIRCEVKSPFRSRGGGVFQLDDDYAALRETVDESSRQFQEAVKNLLIIVPSLRTPVGRDHLVRAFLGDFGLTFRIDRARGAAIEPPRPAFFPRGRLLRRWAPEREPRFTRIAAIMCIEEIIRDYRTPGGGLDRRMDHHVMVLHNPFAQETLPADIFEGYPQMIRVRDEMVWSDENQEDN
jgi:hypothetical protein